MAVACSRRLDETVLLWLPRAWEEAVAAAAEALALGLEVASRALILATALGVAPLRRLPVALGHPLTEGLPLSEQECVALAQEVGQAVSDALPHAHGLARGERVPERLPEPHALEEGDLAAVAQLVKEWLELAERVAAALPVPFASVGEDVEVANALALADRVEVAHSEGLTELLPLEEVRTVELPVWLTDAHWLPVAVLHTDKEAEAEAVG